MQFQRLEAITANPARSTRAVATGLLILMAAVFATAHAFEGRYPWLGYVGAFAEAAMVGGLADWFAVTALFRHPLGLPIPHTAIIPRNKDRIGDNLAQFLRNNFLTPSIVARRLERFDMAAVAGRWLAQPPGSGRLRRGFGRLVVQFLEALDDQTIGGMVRGAVSSRIRSMEVSPLLGSALEGAVESNRHHALVDTAIEWAGRTLEANESTIREMVHNRTNWILRLASIDDRVADQIIDGLRRLLSDVVADPEHPIRLRATQGLRELAFDLKHLPETRAKVEAIKNELIEHPDVAAYIDGLWTNAKRSIMRAAQDPDAAYAGKLGEALRRLGETLNSEPKLRASINSYTRRAVVGMVADYGDELVRLVSDTIRGWDARTVTDKLEAAVGRDLQYIRINGTLIGGLVGLTIYTITELV